MPFDWKGFLDLARDLHQTAAASPRAEALLRSAVSRAYFAAFCHARNYAASFLNFDPKNGPDDHGALRDHLKRGKRKGYADRLQQLRQLRNEADYLDTLPWSDAAATVAAALASADFLFQAFSPPSTPK